MSLIIVIMLVVIGIIVISAIVLAACRKAKYGRDATVSVKIPVPAAAQPKAASDATGILLSVACPGCGAENKVMRGQSVECEYCGAAVEGK
jgi:hypothetical protein